MSSPTGWRRPRIRQLLGTPSFESEALPLIMLSGLVAALTALVMIFS